MYAQHSKLSIPADSNQSIWRYMSFAEFVWLLHSHSLRFTKIKKLIESDRWEGAVPIPSLPGLSAAYASSVKESAIKQRGLISVNCWCISDHQRAAMWGLHAPGTSGIAIKSTFRRLCDSFHIYDRDVTIGCVSYINHTSDDPGPPNTFLPSFYKSRVYVDEHELRAAISHSTEGDIDPRGTAVLQCGFDVEIDFDVLVDEVFVTPIAGDWEVVAVQSALDKYGLARTARHSDIYDGPGY